MYGVYKYPSWSAANTEGFLLEYCLREVRGKAGWQGEQQCSSVATDGGFEFNLGWGLADLIELTQTMDLSQL